MPSLKKYPTSYRTDKTGASTTLASAVNQSARNESKNARAHNRAAALRKPKLRKNHDATVALYSLSRQATVYIATTVSAVVYIDAIRLQHIYRLVIVSREAGGFHL